MNILRALRRSLSLKVFVTYLVVIVIGGIALITTAELVMPAAFERHLAAMALQMGDAAQLSDDLFQNFRHALVDAGLMAILIATALALGLSVYISRQVVAPIKQVVRATRRIAAGHYDERVGIVSADVADVDELGQLALSFNRMAAALEGTEKMRIELIGDVAHELRTPLASITAYMEGLTDGVLPNDATTFIKVRREADRLQRLVRDLQELSRVQEGAIALNLQPLSVDKLIGATLQRLLPQYEAQGILLASDLEANLPPIRGDEDRLTQVLVNLLGNALQYSSPDQTVTMRARRAGPMVEISVTDQGLGISAEHLPFVFDRFYRVDRSRARASGGSGIGLTIARRLVELHGGTIAAASAGLGQGSTFSFTVPTA